MGRVDDAFVVRAGAIWYVEVNVYSGPSGQAGCRFQVLVAGHSTGIMICCWGFLSPPRERKPGQRWPGSFCSHHRKLGCHPAARASASEQNQRSPLLSDARSFVIPLSGPVIDARSLPSDIALDRAITQWQ
jgi:hypothetical protein